MHVVSRRGFLTSLAAAAAAPKALLVEARVRRTLRFDHTHTGERLTID